MVAEVEGALQPTSGGMQAGVEEMGAGGRHGGCSHLAGEVKGEAGGLPGCCSSGRWAPEQLEPAMCHVRVTGAEVDTERVHRYEERCEGFRV